nr:MAG TPA: hypothetical protein [Caudoviricetes sp.]
MFRLSHGLLEKSLCKYTRFLLTNQMYGRIFIKLLGSSVLTRL